MNLYKLHNTPEKMYKHDDPTTKHILALQKLFVSSDQEKSAESVDEILDYIEDNINDSTLLPVLAKNMRLLKQDDPVEFTWILEQLPDNVVNKLSKVKPAK